MKGSHIANWGYHQYKEKLQLLFQQPQTSSSKDEIKAKDVISFLFPFGKAYGWFLFIIFILILLLRVPSQIDSTLWIGTFGFEGTICIAFLALGPWYSRMLYETIGSLIKNAIKYGFIKWNQPENEYHSMEQFIEEKVAKAHQQGELRISADLIRRTLIVLVYTVILAPLYPWFSNCIKDAFMVNSAFVVIRLVLELVLLIAVYENDVMWKVYRYFEKFHEAQTCAHCTHTSDSQTTSVHT